jgi:hypothetical protein
VFSIYAQIKLTHVSQNKSSGIQKYVPFAILISGTIAILNFLLPKAKNLLDVRNLVNFEISRVYAFNYAGGILGNFTFNIDIKVTNPTNAMVNIKKPYIKAHLNNNYIGDTEPSGDFINIQPNSSGYINEIKVRVPLNAASKLINYIPQLASGNSINQILVLQVITEINGLPIEKYLEYQL